MSLPFEELASTSARLAATRSRLEKKRLLVEVLAKVDPAELGAAVGWLVAEPLCGPLGFGPAHLWELNETAPAERAGVTLRDVEEALEVARGAGRAQASSLVAALFARLASAERAFFVGSLTHSLRQGSLGGVMMPALAELSGRSEEDVRRAVMVGGSIARAAAQLSASDAAGATARSIVPFHPLVPMLASPADSIDAALEGGAAVVVEWKVDGVRAQVHKKGDRLAIYSRQGNDITARCGSLLGALASLRCDAAVLDGEVVLVGLDGAPKPFQDSFSAVASADSPGPDGGLRLYVFDCLHRDGVDLLDEPLRARVDVLRAVVPEELRMPGLRPETADAARRFYAEAVARGHEGVVVKDLDSPYRSGARGRSWRKVKEHATIDLVVLAVEWGSGRRRGWLSNLHLGARRADGTFCMVGKTFKGLTDATLRWQTARLQELATERSEHVVFVRPELVVEIRYSDVQRSSRYPGGVALRFARVARYREDKSATEVEPLESLVARLPRTPQPRPERGKTRKSKDTSQLSLFDE